MVVKVYGGDCLSQLKGMRSGSVHSIVTSPPYYGLRDYGVDGQLGLEQTPEDYVQAMVEVFREARRVLRDDGTLWLNLGDSYAGAGYSNHANTGGAKCSDGGKQRHLSGTGLKNKDLIGIPWRVALALQADGWYLRQDIIWHKPNPMPESVKDRCTKAHEYIFMLTKSQKYYYDAESVKEDCSPANVADYKRRRTMDNKGKGGYASVRGDLSGSREQYMPTDFKRNRRSVWTVTSKPYKGAHFATFPPDLIAPCVLAGVPEQCCSECGKPGVPVYEKTDIVDVTAKGSRFDKGKTAERTGGDRAQEGARTISVLTGYEPGCNCQSGSTRGVVLDPFGGSGTTALVADSHGRDAVLIELNPDYIELMKDRLKDVNLRVMTDLI